MNEDNDIRLAKFLLETRQDGDFMFHRRLKRHAWRWIPFFVFGAFFLSFGIFEQQWWISCLTIGLFIGIIGRDIETQDTQRQNWSFYAKVIDWAKVEQIAKSEPLP